MQSSCRSFLSDGVQKTVLNRRMMLDLSFRKITSGYEELTEVFPEGRPCVQMTVTGEEGGLGLEYGAHGKRVRRVYRARLDEHPNVQDGSREFKLT